MAFESDLLTRTKLCILYLLQAVDLPLNNQQVVLYTDFFFVDRFSLAQALQELLDAGFLQKNETEYFSITPRGRETLSMFTSELPVSVRSKLDDSAAEICRQVRREAEYFADYHQLDERRFALDLKINEFGKPIFSVSLELPTRTQAEQLCAAWAQIANDVYARVLKPVL